MRCLILVALLETLSFQLCANAVDYWLCTVTDAEYKQWTGTSSYQRTAINTAYDQCKKESAIPDSCKAAREACEPFSEGMSTQPLWQCTALDNLANPWESNPYPHRDDAAIAAKAYCREQSTAPDTCYVNLLTCRNLRE